MYHVEIGSVKRRILSPEIARRAYRKIHKLLGLRRGGFLNDQEPIVCSTPPAIQLWVAPPTGSGALPRPILRQQLPKYGYDDEVVLNRSERAA
ncbi:MAG: hypothetical protein R3C17_05620 [Planctomycetaceae bacterium]